MANEEQVKILKQGVEVWNKWREENPRVEVDLSGADFRESNLYRSDLSGVNLSGAFLRGTNLRESKLYSSDLSGVCFSGADLREADLWKANFMGADLGGANLSRSNLTGSTLYQANLKEANLSRATFLGVDLSYTDLSGANFSRANLREANLSDANLRKANLKNANLSDANLKNANLCGADLRDTNLIGTNLRDVDLREANLKNASLGNTIIAKIDLCQVHRLENIHHRFPSTIGTDTIQLSKGEIPEIFLRGCGLSDWEIESSKLYKPELSNQEIIDINYKIFDLRANQAIQISPLFISYSHADARFVEKLEPYLTEKGIRFWRDTHDMKSGRMEKQVDHAMRQNPTVILILSENSTRSDWVEHEARLARDLEKEFGRDVLCPIALDESWKSAKWPKRLMEQIMKYNILDYSNWNDDKAFGQVFNKMLSGLDMFYKPDAESPK